MTTAAKNIAGIIAEFEHPGALISAAKGTRDAGYTKFDCLSPFPVHGMDAAMGLKSSKLGWLVTAGGVMGACVAILMQWWMSAVDYPIIVSGKPLFSFQAFVPVTFELTILFSAFATVFGMFAINMLPRLHHPIFNSKHVHRATDDGFFVYIEAADAQFDSAKTAEFLEFLGGKNIESVEDKQ